MVEKLAKGGQEGGLSNAIRQLADVQRVTWDAVKQLIDGEGGKILDLLRQSLESQGRLWQEVRNLQEQVKALQEGQNNVLVEIRKLTENQVSLLQEVRRLAEGQEALRVDVNKLWEENNKIWQEISALREVQNKLLEENNKIWQEIKALREEETRLREGQERLWERYDRIDRKLSAIGARWGGVLSEDAFRRAVEELLSEAGYRVERWSYNDSEGYVFGYPSVVDLDVVIKDDKSFAVEIKSSVGRGGDVVVFKRITESTRGSRVGDLTPST